MVHRMILKIFVYALIIYGEVFLDIEFPGIRLFDQDE